MKPTKTIASIFIALIFCVVASAQTSSIGYQGKLTDAGVPANGTYDFIFKLISSGGTQIGADAPVNDVTVTNGIFNVLIPFEESSSNFVLGSQKYLEILVRPGASTGAYTTLSPRQEFGSVPTARYSRWADNSGSATFAQNANALNNVPAGQYVLTGDARLSDARPPTPGSANYIQNGTGMQTDTNFNISGNGTAGGTLSAWIVSATNQVNVAGDRAFYITGDVQLPLSNLFIGKEAGRGIQSGNGNTFVGFRTGGNGTITYNNSLFGSKSGSSLTSGISNSMFGNGASNDNSGAGFSTTTGSFNAFFGHRTGEMNTTGDSNSFFGTGAGLFSVSGSDNTFVGHDAGGGNISGSFNSMLGSNTSLGAADLTNATAIGSRARVAQSNSIVLGSINGVNGATADTNVGIGTTSPNARLHVNGTVRVVNGPVVIANPNTLIITSPNGSCWGITVSNAGTLATFPVNPCP